MKNLALEAYRVELARKDLGLHCKGALLFPCPDYFTYYASDVRTICREFV